MAKLSKLQPLDKGIFDRQKMVQYAEILFWDVAIPVMSFTRESRTLSLLVNKGYWLMGKPGWKRTLIQFLIILVTGLCTGLGLGFLSSVVR